MYFWEQDYTCQRVQCRELQGEPGLAHSAGYGAAGEVLAGQGDHPWLGRGSNAVWAQPVAVSTPCLWGCTAAPCVLQRGLQTQPSSKHSVVQLHAEQSVPALCTVRQNCSRPHSSTWLVPCVHFAPRYGIQAVLTCSRGCLAVA